MGMLPETMSTARPVSRDTGFHKPFCGNRNTTLPHPEADLSPGACISAADISVSRAMHRSRRSLLSKNKRTVSHGIITREMEQMYIDARAAAGAHDHDDMAAPHSRDGSESFGRSSESAQGDGDDHARPGSSGSSSRRRNVFQKLLHPHK